MAHKARATQVIPGSRFMLPPRLYLLVYAILTGGIGLFLALVVVKDFGGPLIGNGDTNLWDYLGYYVSQNLHFLPWPQLDLVNDQLFYPYGNNHAMQAWCVERDLWFAWLFFLFGHGPWLQLYFVVSGMVTFAGSAALLTREVGPLRACLTGMIVTLFNFYALFKYPGHLNIAILHWTTLSIVADYLIVSRVVMGRRVPLRLLLLRGVLLLLSLGQDLGYVAGYGLASMVLTALFAAVVMVRRRTLSRVALRTALRNYRAEGQAHLFVCGTLVLAGFLAGFFYLPLVLQLAANAQALQASGAYNGAWWWAIIYRLAVPYLPGFNPARNWLQPLLPDFPEGLGAGSPGWFLLALAGLGFWSASYRWRYAPLLLLFALCLFNHPPNFSTLGIFPWFAYHRVGDRATVIYPVILGLLALFVDPKRWHRRLRVPLLVFLVALGMTELVTAHTIRAGYRPPSLASGFWGYMDRVRRSPGEAVLDWPFCVAGGNGVALDRLCPYYNATATGFALSRFHGKKVTGGYYGRLHPSQVAPFLAAGWDKVFVPNDYRLNAATGQRRCFTPEEWEFFQQFFAAGDFAGINLYVDLMPPACTAAFIARFGPAVAETSIPDGGRLMFIPKPPQLRLSTDPARARRLSYTLPKGQQQLVASELPIALDTELGPVTRLAQGEEAIVLSNSETAVRFYLPGPLEIELSFSLVNRVPEQSLSISVNGVATSLAERMASGASITRRLRFRGKAREINNVTFVLTGDAHHAQGGSPVRAEVRYLTLKSYNGAG